MTTLLDSNGKPVMHVLSPTKKAHDPEEAKRERARLQGVFRNLMQQFVQDISQPEDFPPVMEVDLQAAMEHHDAKWRDTCKVTNESSLPVKADPDALMKEMKRITEDARMQRLAQTPLHKVADLAEYHLRSIGMSIHGLLHINTRVAVAIDAEGNTTVWLRGQHERMEDWCSGWGYKPWREPIVQAASYTLGELNNLLAITRRPDVNALSEEMMERARLTKALRGILYLRWR